MRRVLVLLLFLAGCDARQPPPTAETSRPNAESSPARVEADADEPPIVRTPNLRFRREGPIFADGSITSVTIDPVSPNDVGHFAQWRPDEADVRKMIRTYDEVDEWTWLHTNTTAGERRGTLKLVDGGTIEWRWLSGGLVTLADVAIDESGSHDKGSRWRMRW
jgi:hypothetical protein